MSDATSVLFGLEHEFSVLEVQRVDVSLVRVIIEQTALEGPCPGCGVFSGAVKDRPVMRLRDLPMSGQTVELWWRKRRLVCAEAWCLRKSFSQVSAAVQPRARVTERLRSGWRWRSRRATGPSRRSPSNTRCRGRLRTRRWWSRPRGGCQSRRRSPAGDR